MSSRVTASALRARLSDQREAHGETKDRLVECRHKLDAATAEAQNTRAKLLNSRDLVREIFDRLGEAEVMMLLAGAEPGSLLASVLAAYLSADADASNDTFAKQTYWQFWLAGFEDSAICSTKEKETSK